MKNYQILLIFFSFLLTFQVSEVQSKLAGQYMHLSDIHLDLEYVPNSSALLLSCHSFEGFAGKFGTRLACDNYIKGIELLMDYLSEFYKSTPVDFIIWTGDNARHESRAPFSNLFSRTPQDIIDDNAKIAQIMKATFPNQIIIPNIGNNDVYPHDQLSSTPNNTFLYQLSQIWSSFLNETEIQQFQYGGYFTKDINEDLVVMSINTIYLFSSNSQVSDCSNSSSASYIQIQWMNQTLANMVKNGKKVIIIGHVPPTSFYPVCKQMYYELANEYVNTIIGHQYGHLHTDEFFLIPATGNNKNLNNCSNIGVINCIPSVVPSFNPSVRIQRFQQTYPYKFINYTQYFGDLDELNYGNANSFPMQVEYEFPSAFQQNDMSADSYCSIYQQIQDKNSDISQLYKKFQYVSLNKEEQDALELILGIQSKQIHLSFDLDTISKLVTAYLRFIGKTSYKQGQINTSNDQTLTFIQSKLLQIVQNHFS